MKSIASPLVLIGLPLLALLLVVHALTSYGDARRGIHRAHDRGLQAALVHLRSGTIPPESIRETLAASLGVAPQDTLFTLADAAGHVLAGDRDVPYTRPDAATPLRLLSAHHRGRPVRVAALFHPTVVVGQGSAPAIWVVGEVAGPRNEEIHRLVLHELRRHVLTALALVVLVWLWRRAMREALREPARNLAARQAEDLTPLPLDPSPSEIRPFIEAVNQHRARVAGLFESSRRFAADVAHQLRTPLTLLGAQAQYGLRHAEPEKMRAAMEDIAAASRAAQRLCNQMLSLSRVEAARGAIHDGVRVDLVALLRDTALDLSMLALDKRIDLAFHDGGEPASVTGDEIMLHELFSNLIDNALRYTPGDGRVDIRLRLAAGEAEVSIIDGGPGIAPARRAAAFQRFHKQFDRQGGTGAGLGLAIAHQITLAHGGSIGFEDTPEGFAVRVRLPLGRPALSEGPKAS